MRTVEQNIALFMDLFHVSVVITPEVEIEGKFRKRYQNVTMVFTTI